MWWLVPVALGVGASVYLLVGMASGEPELLRIAWGVAASVAILLIGSWYQRS